MKINLFSKTNEDVSNDEIDITVEFSVQNDKIENFIKYINNYNIDSTRKIIVTKNYELVEINYEDIILFYSDKKNNYCRTKDGKYKIKSKLYELERMDVDFIRISKGCIINVNHVESFDISETGKIIVRLDDKTEEIVSRRKIRDVINYLDERGI